MINMCKEESQLLLQVSQIQMCTDFFLYWQCVLCSCHICSSVSSAEKNPSTVEYRTTSFSLFSFIDFFFCQSLSFHKLGSSVFIHFLVLKESCTRCLKVSSHMDASPDALVWFSVQCKTQTELVMCLSSEYICTSGEPELTPPDHNYYHVCGVRLKTRMWSNTNEKTTWLGLCVRLMKVNELDWMWMISLHIMTSF